MNGTYDLTFTRIAYQDDFNGGLRFATDWTGEDGRQWRVSSVDNSTALETMVFEIVDDEVNYFDVAATKEYMENKREHGAFLAEYLQRELDERIEAEEGAPNQWMETGMPISVRLRGCPPDLSTFTEDSP